MTSGSLPLQEGGFFFIQFNVRLLLLKVKLVKVYILHVWLIDHAGNAATLEP